MLHTTLVFEALCCLHFHYFFYVIFSFLLFFFLRAAQQFSPPAKRKLSSIACPAVLPLLPWRQIPLCLRRCCCYFAPSVCILNYPWANGLCVCVCCCAALPCSHFLLSSFPSSSHLLSNLASWFLFSLFLLHMPIGNADVDSFMPQLIRFDKESSPVYNRRATTT